MFPLLLARSAAWEFESYQPRLIVDWWELVSFLTEVACYNQVWLTTVGALFCDPDRRILKTLLQKCRFHFFLFYRRQPVAAAATGLTLLAALISTIAWAMIVDAHEDAKLQLQVLTASHQLPLNTPAVQSNTNTSVPDLPIFSSSSLTADFHAIADSVKLPIKEVSYTLENSVNQPYLRYRVTMAVKTEYPAIRKFAAALTTALPNVALDGVRCGKANAAPSALSCQLAFSAFYRKSGRG